MGILIGYPIGVVVFVIWGELGFLMMGALFAPLVIDGVLPTITSVKSTSVNATYGIGANINITVNFSESVSLSSSGTLTVTLDVPPPPAFILFKPSIPILLTAFRV